MKTSKTKAKAIGIVCAGVAIMTSRRVPRFVKYGVMFAAGGASAVILGSVVGLAVMLHDPEFVIENLDRLDNDLRIYRNKKEAQHETETSETNA